MPHRVLFLAVVALVLVSACRSEATSRAVPTATPTVAVRAAVAPAPTNTSVPAPATPTSAPLRPTPRPAPVYVANTGPDGLSFRPQPGSSDRVAVLPQGTELTATGEHAEAGGRVWLRVLDAGGREGWVAEEFTSATAPPTPTAQAVAARPPASSAPSVLAAVPATAPQQSVRAPTPMPARPAAALAPTIPYPGNGGGPTLCRDGSVSNSAGSGTCSHHGGVAPGVVLPSTSSPQRASAPASTSSAPKTVNVRGYTRKDGTYVRPHTRSAPRRR